jgi:hypothetical protein
MLMAGVVNGTVPGWVHSPDLAFLFGAACKSKSDAPDIDLLLANIPVKTSPKAELVLSIPDAINRCLLVTRFSRIDGPLTLRILVPIINAVPFAALSFGGFNFFTDMRWSAPAEVMPYGWAMVDTWIPLVTVLYQYLQHQAWSEKDALGVCILFTIGVFVARAYKNSK